MPPASVRGGDPHRKINISQTPHRSPGEVPGGGTDLPEGCCRIPRLRLSYPPGRQDFSDKEDRAVLHGERHQPGPMAGGMKHGNKMRGSRSPLVLLYLPVATPQDGVSLFPGLYLHQASKAVRGRSGRSERQWLGKQRLVIPQDRLQRGTAPLSPIHTTASLSDTSQERWTAP